MNKPDWKSIAQYARMLLLVISLLSFPVAATAYPIWELRVTAARVRGTCLYGNEWIPIDQRSLYLYWELILIDDSDENSGKPGDKGQYKQSHEYSLLSPQNTGPASATTDGDVAFKLDVIDERKLEFFRQASKASSISGDYAYIDAMRVQLKKPNLLPATVVRNVPERELYELNKLNDFNPFRDNDVGVKVRVPVSRSGCDLQIKYIMQSATARYKKNLFGRKTLISDETAPLSQGEKTFAENFLTK